MFNPLTVIIVVCLYIGILFLIALWVEKKSSTGMNIGNNPIIYSLSFAVYCTTWTYYGSVGKAANSGMLFLTIYLGPTITMILGWVILRRMIHIKNTFKITSIADFISARYNKSQGIAMIVTILAVVGITPYIALQFKAVFSTFDIITHQAALEAQSPFGINMGLIVVLFMTVFTIMFGVRRLDPTERHQGMVVALSIECVVKLVAFLAAGIFVTFFLFDGFGEIFKLAQESSFVPFFKNDQAETSSYLIWMTYLVLAMSAILFLPRQFHISVIENFKEDHIKTAMWFFPLYMLLINLFVYPIALAGVLKGYPINEADNFVLSLPLNANAKILSLLVFIGGFSAATGMIMISSMTMATMITNHLLLPFITWMKKLDFLKRYLLQCRWVSVALYIFFGYVFEREVGETFMLVNMGMISFAAVLQFAPSLIGGLFWKQGNKAGSMLGLSAGFAVWAYTLVLPTFVKSRWLPEDILEKGPFGIEFLRPEHLFGLNGFDPLSHAVFWTLFFNIGFYVFGSLLMLQKDREKSIAEEFVDILDRGTVTSHHGLKKEMINLKDKRKVIEDLLRQYFPRTRSREIITTCLETVHIEQKKLISIVELTEFYNEIEKVLAGSIGVSAAYYAIRSSISYSEEEEKELSQVYAEILTDLKLTPSELKKKVDYYHERERLLTYQSHELEEKVRERDNEITERKRIEEALKESEEKYRTLIENVNIGVYRNTGGPHGRFLQANPAFARIFGYDSIEEVMEIKVSDLYQNPDDRGAFVEKIKREGLVKDEELKLRKKDGTAIWASLTAKAQFDEHGDIDWIDGVVEDITENKKLEEQLRQSHKMEAIGTLAGGIAHDFNNILTAIIGYGTLLQQEVQKDKHLQQLVNHIISAGERAASLTQSLLTFSRKQIISLRPVDINGIIQMLEKLLLRVIGEDIELRTRLPATDLIVMADPGQIEQVLMNLAANARDAMPKGGLLTILTERIEFEDDPMRHDSIAPGAYALISFSDTGIGIDERSKERIFEPFFTTKEIGRGTGLGLSMTYGIIKQHNGEIMVFSEPGAGTTFNIYLPLIETKVEEEYTGQSGLSVEKGVETILVAEDNQEVRRLTRSILKDAGYTVLEAVDGDDTIQIFTEKSDSIDLVLLDMIMPKKDGKEVLEEIRDIRPDIKSVFMSGYTADIIERKGVIRKGFHFIPKPFTPERLLKTIREALDGKA